MSTTLQVKHGKTRKHPRFDAAPGSFSVRLLLSYRQNSRLACFPGTSYSLVS